MFTAEILSNGWHSSITHLGGYLHLFISLAIITFILALAVTFFIMFAFTDMTRKQIILSASIAVIIEIVLLRLLFPHFYFFEMVFYEIHWILGWTIYQFTPLHGFLFDFLYDIFWSIGFAVLLVLSARSKNIKREFN
jgi:hypothetical protein